MREGQFCQQRFPGAPYVHGKCLEQQLQNLYSHTVIDSVAHNGSDLDQVDGVICGMLMDLNDDEEKESISLLEAILQDSIHQYELNVNNFPSNVTDTNIRNRDLSSKKIQLVFQVHFVFISTIFHHPPHLFCHHRFNSNLISATAVSLSPRIVSITCWKWDLL